MYSSLEATCPSIPAALFASRLCFIRFVFVVRSCFVWRTKAEARARVGRPQTRSFVIFFLFHIEIEGKGGWTIGGGQRVCWPPSQNIGGGWPPLPPLFLRLCTPALLGVYIFYVPHK